MSEFLTKSRKLDAANPVNTPEKGAARNGRSAPRTQWSRATAHAEKQTASKEAGAGDPEAVPTED